MSGPEFFQTGMGHQYYQDTMPRIARALEKIAEEMEKEANLLSLIAGDRKLINELNDELYKTKETILDLEKIIDGTGEMEVRL